MRRPSRSLRRAATYIGIGLANLCNILNPELFVLGGGVANSGAFFLDMIRETIPLHAMAAIATSASCAPPWATTWSSWAPWRSSTGH